MLKYSLKMKVNIPIACIIYVPIYTYIVCSVNWYTFYPPCSLWDKEVKIWNNSDCLVSIF